MLGGKHEQPEYDLHRQLRLLVVRIRQHHWPKPVEYMACRDLHICFHMFIIACCYLL